MNCRVVVEAAVPVYDVETPDEAVRIAISKTGEMLNPDLNYVEINMGARSCPHCGESLEPAFIAADESLVALELEMTVFNVERDEHAARIARKEIGQRLENIPLEVLEIEELEEESDEDGGGDAGGEEGEGSEEEEGEEESEEDDEEEGEGASEEEGEGASEEESEGGEGDEAGGEDGDVEAEERDGDSAERTEPKSGATGDDDGSAGEAGEEEILPEFEELIEDEDE